MSAGNTTARGYGNDHQQLRRQYKPHVDGGTMHCAQPVCVKPNRWIEPGTPWALGHNDDRTGYLGPVHAECNQLDGARKGGRAKARGRVPTVVAASRRW